MTRLSLVVRGTVQGVGFRPWVYEAATSRGLVGFVKNASDAVRIEIEGDEASIRSFRDALACIPLPARVASIEERSIPRCEDTTFEIVASDLDAPVHPVLPPDLATCDACWREFRDPRERRYRYPFTNCARCGPRYSIALSLPYDRARTTMQTFAMCTDCRREYEDVRDRRHHAQPIACPACGPRLEWRVRKSPMHPESACGELQSGEDALACALSTLARGGVVALRGLGGFQLLCDATNDHAVALLRARKRRPHKPFAVMFRDIDQLRAHADVTDDAMLRSSAAPIVLYPRRSPSLSRHVSEGPWVGAMLPYTPLHALVVNEIPLVCTSGNLANEPICTSIEEAMDRLGAIADGFLTHDRPIARPVDDSVVRASGAVVRRARGLAPLPMGSIDARASVLGVGAHMKCTVTLAHRGTLIGSQHIGDLDSLESRALLERTVADLFSFFGARPSIIACDLHPDYASTRFAERLAMDIGAKLVRVQHHHAHVASCVAEHGIEGRVLGLAWDGTGLGTDGTIWGGEALICEGARFTRFAHLAPFPLVGGDRAARSPRRAMAGVLHAHAPEEMASLRKVADRDRVVLAAERFVFGRAPVCSSMGRLFDAVAAIVGHDEDQTYEGQAAMKLEHLARQGMQGLPNMRDETNAYPFPLEPVGGSMQAMPGPMLRALRADLRADVSRAIVARRFHASLVSLGRAMAKRADIGKVVLSGGCFQNQLLVDGLASALVRDGFEVFVAREIPTNDGGISFGQAWIGARVG